MTVPPEPAGVPAPPADRWPWVPWHWRHSRRQAVVSQIGLWGATQSGKTVLLGVLPIARDLHGPEWGVSGLDDDTMNFLIDARERLETGFLPGGTAGHPQMLRLRITKARHSSWAVRLLSASARRREFHVTLFDVPGALYGPREPIRPSPPEPPVYIPDPTGTALFTQDSVEPLTVLPDDVLATLVDHLARADGIVYLFDAVAELEDGRSYRYLRSMLERIDTAAAALGREIDGKLPHFVAVCIHKFDDPVVLRNAVNGGFITGVEGPTLTPRVDENEAKQLFEYICGVRGKTSADPGIGPTPAAIEGHFLPGRVRYFVSSSVGFHVGPAGFFRYPADPVGSVWNDPTTGLPRVRGQIRPINVIEPLLWLEDSIRRHRPPVANAAAAGAGGGADDPARAGGVGAAAPTTADPDALDDDELDLGVAATGGPGGGGLDLGGEPFGGDPFGGEPGDGPLPGGDPTRPTGLDQDA